MKRLLFAQIKVGPSATLWCALLLLAFSTIAATSPAQTFTTLADFNKKNGGNPHAPLVQGLNGNFYGTTTDAGANGAGTIYSITPAGVLKVLHSFDGTDGSEPYAGLVLGANGNFYGTTDGGGAYSSGTVFEITPGGKLTTLYNFCTLTGCADGQYPGAALVQAGNGNFYGETNSSGANGYGTVFAITPAGKLTTLYSFCSLPNCVDGIAPDGAIVLAENGNIYGTTEYNSNAVDETGGTVFELTPAGKLTTLYNFCSQGGQTCTDGYLPVAGLMQANNGMLYGTTLYGGDEENDGTFYQITTTGKLTTLYVFCRLANCADGSRPFGPPAQANDGNFYGTTLLGGGNGNIYEMTAAGAATPLYSFCTEANCTDGGDPEAALLQSTNGTLYGTNLYGGGVTGTSCSLSGCGTVYSLSVGLGPLVQTVPTSGKVGAKVTILGNNLTGTTAVTFNGTASAVTVVSPTEITTTVPSGATSGKVKVTTPSGVISTYVVFRVT